MIQRMDRRLLVALLLLGVLAAVTGAGTFAYFSDVEDSTDNFFSAGQIDLKVDWNESSSRLEEPEHQPYTDDPGPVFEFHDLKPGDSGEATISLHVNP